MAKKESQDLKLDDQPAKPGPGLKLGPKTEKALDWFLGVVKFILGLCLLVFVYSATVAFLNQFSLIDKILQNRFWQGAVAFLIIYHLLWEPVRIYNAGHKIVGWLFSFFAPLVKAAPYLVPIYTLVLAVIYLLIYRVADSPRLIQYFMFLFGLTFILHLIFSAKTLRQKKEDFLKSNFIFGYSLVYICDVFMFSFFLGLIFKQFSFIDFSSQFYGVATGIINSVFSQLFL